MKITVGHLYPDQLNIYADRGNIAVLDVRARARGHQLDVRGLGLGDPVAVDEIDLFYIGGGQDRDQRLVAADLAAKGPELAAAAEQGAVFLGVCGGYQLLGRSYHERGGTDIPGIGLLGLETVAGERRLIGDVLIDCDWAGKELAGFENHGGRTILDAGTPALGRLVAGFGNDGSSGFEGAREGRIYGTYLHGPLLPRNPWFADRLLAESIEHRTGEPAELAPLSDELEAAAHAVAAARALARGGRRA